MIFLIDAEFTIYRHEIQFDKFNETFYLIPFGDVHRYADNCDDERWIKFLQWAKKKRNCYFVGTGDYDDFASTSERYEFLTSKIHRTTLKTIDDWADIRIRDFIKEISFMKGRIIGLIEGNHHWRYDSGITTTQKMCEILKCKYLGVSTVLRLVFKYKKGARSVGCDIMIHHGISGGTRLPGTSVNAIKHLMDVAECDIYIMGHDHKKGVWTASRLKLTHGNKRLGLKHRKILLIRSGSFQRGYVPNEYNYVSSRGLPPADLGVVKIELTPKWTTKTETGEELESIDLDLHASI